MVNYRIDEEKVLRETIDLVYNICSTPTKYKYNIADIFENCEILKYMYGKYFPPYYIHNNKFENYLTKLNNENILFNEDPILNAFLCDRVINTFNDNSYVFYNRYPLNKLTQKEFIEIQRDFLYTFEERILKIFDEYSKRELIDLTGCIEDNAITFTKLTSNAHIILLPNRFDINNISILSHELGHLFEATLLDKRSKKQLFNRRFTYEEFISHYLEFNLQHYLKENHIYLKDTLIVENELLNRLLTYFKDMIKSIEELETNPKIEDKNERLSMVNDINEFYSYAYGSLLGLLMHERYIENDKETRKDVDNYLFNAELYSRSDSIELLGINKQDLFDSKVLSKRIKKHNKEYKEIV